MSRRFSADFCFTLLVFVFGVAAAPAAAEPPLHAVGRHLAGPGGFTAPDFNLLINYRAPLPPAPKAVVSLLQDPRRIDSLLPALRASLGERGSDGLDRSTDPLGSSMLVASEPLWPWLDAGAVPRARVSQPHSAKSLAAVLHAGGASLRRFADTLTPQEQRWLRLRAPALFRHNADDTLLGPVERERERLNGEVVVDSVLGLAARLSLPVLAESARDFDEALRGVLAALGGPGGVASAESLLVALRREGIPVFFGTHGRDVHRLEALLAPQRRGIVFDPGGDDHYELAGMAHPGGWLIIIDVEGQDVYRAGEASDTTAHAAALFGAQLIADLAGDDRYEGGDFAFASALMGYARVFDAGGNDRYLGRCASLGFAFHGVAILQDQNGDDEYSSAYLSQGASSTYGFGLLIDQDGDDAYLSRPEFLDDLRYRDRFLSLSQGFSTGFAPHYGGGLGVLWDRAGDDRYTADIFGQGAGYWFGWGVLMDDEGRDRLKAYQYAQGAGIHFAVGTLLDEAGDDVRLSKGVSQGCGHDGGFGLFVDALGNDHNTAVDMSAGAGSANGLGIMVDFAGDDVHDMGNHAMTLGHGDMRRDRASMGFFLDLNGRDAYPQTPPDSANAPRSDVVWRVYDGVKRGHGLGQDAAP